MTTIFFSTSNGWLSTIIRLATGGKVSHTGICTEMYGIPIVIHADFYGVVIEPKEFFLQKGNTIVAEYKHKDVNFTNNLEYAIKKLGMIYNYSGLLGFLPILLIKKIFGKLIKNPLTSPNALICTEFVMKIDYNNNIKEWNMLDAGSTSPEELLYSCENSNDFYKI